MEFTAMQSADTKILALHMVIFFSDCLHTVFYWKMDV